MREHAAAWVQWFWFSFYGKGLRVELPDLPRTNHFRWTNLYGVQIGKWFIGAIRGGEDMDRDPVSQTDGSWPDWLLEAHLNGEIGVHVAGKVAAALAKATPASLPLAEEVGG